MTIVTATELRRSPAAIIDMSQDDLIQVTYRGESELVLMPFDRFSVLSKSYGEAYRQILINSVARFVNQFDNPKPSLRALICHSILDLRAMLSEAWSLGIPADTIRQAFDPALPAPYLTMVLERLMPQVDVTDPEDLEARDYDDACAFFRKGRILDVDEPIAIQHPFLPPTVVLSTDNFVLGAKRSPIDPYTDDLWTILAANQEVFGTSDDPEGDSLSLFACVTLLIDSYSASVPFNTFLSKVRAILNEKSFSDYLNRRPRCRPTLVH